MLKSMHNEPDRWAVEETLRTGAGHFEGAYTTISSGKEIVIRTTHKKITSHEGKFVVAIGIFENITERKRAEDQLREHNRLLEEAVQQKQREMEALFDKLLRQEKLATIGKMAGSIAHELRNPLGAVKQSVYYLK